MVPVSSPPVMSESAALLEAFFEHAQDGFYFMMIDPPVAWGPHADTEALLDHIFLHQRLTRVNPALARQFRTEPAALIGLTPADLFRDDLAAGRRLWRALFDAGHARAITEERRHDGSVMRIEGDYTCFHDADGRITGHFAIRRDVTDRALAAAELEESRAELRALAARLQATREEERARIAREIHDELGQALTALKLDLAWLEQRLVPGTAGASGLGELSIASRIDETMQVVRRIASELRPSVLDQLGLEAAIEWLVQDSARRTGIDVRLRAEAFPKLPDFIASHAFRIIQEALTNVTRHSKATRVDVTVRQLGTAIMLVVEDNGVGIMPQSLSGLRSLGLVGMRERAVACGGTLMVRGQPGEGTSIVVTIPVTAA